MGLWTHDELHQLIDTNPQLKAESDGVHALPDESSFEEAAGRKSRMLRIYTAAVGCNRLSDALNALQEVYAYLSAHYVWGGIVGLTNDDWRAINSIAQTYETKRMCHSPLGNNYFCFCNEDQTE